MRSRTLFPIAVADDTSFDAHAPRGPHPERPERLVAARAGLNRALGASDRTRIAARPALHAELLAAHSAEHIARLERDLHGHGYLDADTYVSPGTRAAAWGAAGASVDFAQYLMLERERFGFALLRPPGHHATREAAMGFCYLNNIAIAAYAALAAGAAKVAIVDWDVHHGNGTQAIFEDDPRVLFISLHEWPLYPGTGKASELGRGAGAGFNVNIPLPEHAGPAAYASAFRKLVLPMLDRFGADLTLVSAGFDAHERDPLASMALTSESYGAMAAALLAQAKRSGHSRVGFFLEGGYDLRALDESVGHVTAAMLGTEIPLTRDEPESHFTAAIDETALALAPYWQDLRPYES
ncbi:MAG: histone deacetylase [Sandaracinaceae bacterium]|nr:histone deacetylase [Sandaracinaceae bacterium]